MEAEVIRSKHNTRPPMFLRLYIALGALMASVSSSAAAAEVGVSVQELRRGFLATHDLSYSQFQPLISDPTGVFSLGFLRLNSTLLDLAIVHLPSSLPLWRAVPDRPAAWSAAATLSFDGHLALTDRATNAVLWSTSAAAGDRVVLLNTSNLQIQNSSSGVMWQSFDFPSDTIVQDQNFTSGAALFTSDRRFSMRLGAKYLALFLEPSLPGGASAMYWKHTALEAKAEIAPGGGATYARVDPDGFLGMYQKEGRPADVQSFDTFNRGVSGLRRVTLEPDGNLRAYYWNGSSWVLDYTAVTEPCELPTTCGAYRVCASQGQCACLANATDGSGCVTATEDGNLCDGGKDVYQTVRRAGVELVNKELVEFETAVSAGECEARCERNCTCWGAVYSNTTGRCYLLAYPARMLVGTDENKVGYFKVMRVDEEDVVRGGGGAGSRRAKVAALAVGVVVVAVVAVAVGFEAYRMWERRRWVGAADGGRPGGGDDEGLAPGPYKNLGSLSSVEFSSTVSFRK